MNSTLAKYIIQIADNNLILAQRLGELCGHAATIETDIALTNISLDLFGQVRSYYQYAATLLGEDASEDTIAFLRIENEYKNALLVEQPNIDFAYVIARQFLFDHYHLLFLKQLQHSSDETLRAIALKSIKEVTYHVRFSSDWILRLGDGTEESRMRITEAIEVLWRYTKELVSASPEEFEMSEAGIGVNPELFRDDYYNSISEILREATIPVPEMTYFQKGGKQGMHTEHMGFILAEMQYMQRTYPNMNW